MARFRNPVLPGFHPDPSICRVGTDYYLVTSTFEYFPGLPLYHSRDLVHWRQLGHVLDRPDQLPLAGVRSSNGLFAPTIRYHDGRFYVICTLVGGHDRAGTFVVTAADPTGPWSDPYWLPEAEGIDPSLFFDNGRAWCVGCRPLTEPDYPGQTEIWLREFDPIGMRLVGAEQVIWRSALGGAVWTEAPHLYKVDGRYYLLTAEGGTGHDHAVMIARADQITGPYQGSPRNPVLTHRHLGRDHPIVGTGHGDLVCTPGGQWWMVLLGMRPYGGYFYNLGRETFLVPVRWAEGWPVASEGTGRVEDSYPAPDLPEHRWPAEPATDNFEAPTLAPLWNVLRTPDKQFWSLEAVEMCIRDSLDTPSFVGRRQQHIDFAARTAVDFQPESEHESAGLALVQSDAFHLTLTVTGRRQRVVRLARRYQRSTEVLAEAPVAEGRVYLGVEARGQNYQMRFATRPDRWKPLGEPVDGRLLSTPVAGGFVGTYLGVYATSDGQPSSNHADFDWFEYLALDAG